MEKSQPQVLRFGMLIGVSRDMQQIFRKIEHVGGLLCPVLILGESGTGKELVARAIHASGALRDRQFVGVDCSALSSSLFESEMFGHVRGAFTGAERNRGGLMEAANSGTLFLDEIGNLPCSLQAKLLRAIQEREFRPVGANGARPFTGRIISATNEDIEHAVSIGQFRADLYYRLNVVQISIPPLRYRREDIRLLADAFTQAWDQEMGIHYTISDSGYERLRAYHWPGNVRELQNVIARAVLNEDQMTLEFRDLDASRTQDEPPVETLASLERQAILKAIQTAGDKASAAKKLGLGKTTLYRKLKQYTTLESIS